VNTCHVIRDPRRVVLTTAGQVIFCADDAPIVQPTNQPAAWSALVHKITVPIRQCGLLESDACPPELGEALLERLIDAGCLMTSTDAGAALDLIARSACSDLLSLTVTASEAPVLLAPVMNGTMWNNTGVQRNLHRLREDGRFILEPTIIFGAADFRREAPRCMAGTAACGPGRSG